MGFHTFTQIIRGMVAKKVGRGHKVILSSIQRNNQTSGTALAVVPKSAGNFEAEPWISLDSYYRAHLYDNMSLTEVADRIYDISMAASKANREWQQMREKIYPRLVNAGWNSKDLEGRPHRKFLDLAVIYITELGNKDEGLGYKITNSYMKRWGITEEELFRQATENCKRDTDYSLKSMVEILGIDMMREVTGGREEPPFYVFRYDRTVCPTACILNEQILQEVSQQMNGDFFLLPSSVHEWLVIPLNERYQPDELADLVRSVNRSTVSEDERLSDSVYRYFSDKRKVEIVA